MISKEQCYGALYFLFVISIAAMCLAGSGCSVATPQDKFNYEAHYEELRAKVELIRSTSCIVGSGGSMDILGNIFDERLAVRGE